MYVAEIKTNETKPRFTAHLWTPEGELTQSFLEFRAAAGIEYFTDVPTAYLLDGMDLWVGLSSGATNKVDIRKLEVVDRVESIQPELAEDPRNAKQTSIRQLAKLGDYVFSASYGGLVEVASGRVLDRRPTNSVEVVDGRVLFVPHGKDPQTREGSRTWDAQTGHLIDGITGKVVYRDAEPFDGSGHGPDSAGKHIIVGGRVYTAHGNSVCHMSIGDLAKGKSTSGGSIWATDGFIEHLGGAYDIRWLKNGNREQPHTKKGIVRSDCTRRRSTEEEKEGVVFVFPFPTDEKSFGRVVSGGNLGFLMSSFEDGRTRIVSHHDLDDTLLEVEGHLTLTKL